MCRSLFKYVGLFWLQSRALCFKESFVYRSSLTYVGLLSHVYVSFQICRSLLNIGSCTLVWQRIQRLFSQVCFCLFLHVQASVDIYRSLLTYVGFFWWRVARYCLTIHSNIKFRMSANGLGTCVCVRVCCACVCVHVCCACVCVFTCRFVCICRSMCVCVCVCVWERERENE